VSAVDGDAARFGVFDGVADEIAAGGVVHHVEVQRVASCGEQQKDHSELRTIYSSNMEISLVNSGISPNKRNQHKGPFYLFSF
jgi:hypothetical protein